MSSNPKMSNLDEVFLKFQKELDNEASVKEELYAIIRAIDQSCRKMQMSLQIIHQTIEKSKISAVLSECREILNSSIGPNYKKIEQLLLANNSIPPFYQYHDLWRFVTQRLTFLVSLIIFMSSGRCGLYEDVASSLSMNTMDRQGLCLDLEDYLIGLLSLANELSRLSVTSVTNGDYNKPLEISKFVAELSAGYRLLTFKNDYLRKKYDALKYDVKKIEEIIQDVFAELFYNISLGAGSSRHRKRVRKDLRAIPRGCCCNLKTI